MSLTAIIAAIRDGLILAGVGYLVWFIHTEATDAAKVKDLQAVQKQLQVNATDVARWAEETRSAQNQQRQDMSDVSAAIASQQRPLYLMPNAGGRCSVSPSAPASAGSAATQGATPAGPGGDLRPQINAFELKYEGYLAACRSFLTQWPR